MVENIVDEIIMKLSTEDLSLSSEQLRQIETTLYATLSKYEISLKSTEVMPLETDWQSKLEYYLARKQLAGKSQGTIDSYRFHLTRALATFNKKVGEVTETDVLLYIAAYRRSRNVGNVYLNTIRVCLNSFFDFLVKKKEITFNPVAGIEKIKTEKRVKKAYSDEELERIRRSCETLRDMAMIEFLYATGVRVSEMVALNRDDIEINDAEVIVFGKGAKERRAFLTAVSCMYLREYLAQRTDDNPALFVSMDAPYKRFGKRGVEMRLQRIGQLAGVDNVHPHRFRRTTATNLLRKGMPIEEVKEILGHESISTTLIYASVNKDSLKEHHRRFMTA